MLNQLITRYATGCPVCMAQIISSSSFFLRFDDLLFFDINHLLLLSQGEREKLLKIDCYCVRTRKWIGVAVKMMLQQQPGKTNKREEGKWIN